MIDNGLGVTEAYKDKFKNKDGFYVCNQCNHIHGRHKEYPSWQALRTHIGIMHGWKRKHYDKVESANRRI